MRVFFFLAILLVSLPSLAQSSLDSLFVEWKSRKGAVTDTSTVRLLIELALVYRYDNADSAIHFATLAEEGALALDFKWGVGDALTAKGMCYYISGDYDLSLEAHSDALEIHKESGNVSGMALSINGIGLVYMGQEDLQRSIGYFQQAIRINRQNRNEVNLSNNYFNMGIVYDHLEQFDSAHYYLDLAKAMSEQIGNFRTRLMVNNRIGETLFRQGRYREAIEQYKAVLAADYYQSNWETTFAYAGLAQTYVKLKDYPSAIDAGKKAVEYAELVGANWDMGRALEILTAAYEGSKDFENAYLTHKRYKAVNDTLFNQDKEAEINLLFLKQKEAENNELLAENRLKEEQLQRNKLLNAIFAVLVVSLGIIGFFIMRNSRLKHRLNTSLSEQKKLIESKNAELSRLNRTKALILSIISHDLRSPVASLQSMLLLVKEGSVDLHEQPEIFAELEKRVNGIATMMNSLLIWAGGQFTGIKAAPEPVEIAGLVEGLLPIFEDRLQAKQIGIRHTHPQSTKATADPSQLRIIIQNLVSNAIKFTHSGGSIELFYTTEGNLQCLHVKDSGVGMDEKKLQAIQNAAERVTELGTDLEVGTGLGLILVKQFVENNKGKLLINSKPGEGSEFIVCLPKAR